MREQRVPNLIIEKAAVVDGHPELRQGLPLQLPLLALGVVGKEPPPGLDPEVVGLHHLVQHRIHHEARACPEAEFGNPKVD